MPAPHVPPANRLTLPDGRDLTWIEVGDAGGRPVMLFHGTPGSRLDAASLHEAAGRAGLRLIAPDRPGMGGSTFQEARRLLDWPPDVSALAAHLGIGRYTVIGYSGGGPFALACGFARPDEVRGVVSVSGCGPVENATAVFDTGFLDAVLGAAARWAPAAASAGIWLMGVAAQQMPAVAARVWEADLLPAERRALHAIGPIDPSDELAPFLEALAQGPRGAALDYRLLVERWGFLPEEVTVPVLQWHGDADGVVSPHEAIEVNIRLPNAELRIVPGAGHLLLHTRAATILDAVPAW